MSFVTMKDPQMRIDAINNIAGLQFQDHNNTLRLLAKVIRYDTVGRVKLTAIDATIQVSANLSTDLHPDVLPALAKAVSDDERGVRLAAIGATIQLSTYLHPDVLTALAKAICDIDQDVKLAAINATFQLPFVLPALAVAIYNFEEPEFQELAASAVINISDNYPPPDTLTPYMRAIVCTLLETHATSRVVLYWVNEEVSLQKVIVWDDIEWHQTRISQSIILLSYFKLKLPRDTWNSIQFSLPLNHMNEFENICGSIINYYV